MDSIAGYAIPATDQDLSAKLFVLPLNAGHTGRIRSYITDRVVPAARKAGLAMTGDAVITLVKDVAVAWCSLAEDSDTGGNPARVKNFSRGDLISTIRDLPDESKTRQLTVEERIAVVERAISFENRPSVRFKLLEQLKTLQQQLGESKGK